MSASPTHSGQWEFYVLTEVPNFAIETTHYTPATYRTQRYTFDSLIEARSRVHEMVIDLLNDGWEPVTERSFKRPFSE